MWWALTAIFAIGIIFMSSTASNDVTSFKYCSKLVLSNRIEGGYTLDPDDKGNWTGGEIGSGILKGTNKGISAAAYPNEDIAGMTDERALFLFKRDYWDKCGLDSNPLKHLNLFIFDCAINQGVSVALLFFNQIKKAGLTAVQQIETFYNLRLEKYKVTKGREKYFNGWKNRIDYVKQVSINNLA